MAKENAFTRVIMKFIRMTSTRRDGTDSTTKSAKEFEIGDVARANGVRSLSGITMRSNIAETQEVMKGTRPKLRRESRARKH